jgi:hypothetical protein
MQPMNRNHPWKSGTDICTSVHMDLRQGGITNVLIVFLKRKSPVVGV